ncbi:MAG: ABC transporter ATP-binding protein [Candidatus Bipolaricaulota bacterium]|nr:ABC transporter ATP-binding protein [Candidatus Bipolaricaulota bacterium]
MIKLENATRTYHMGKTDVAALRGVDLEIEDGELVAIMGPSGSGKSTLMHLIGALDQPDEGSMMFGEQDVSKQDRNQLAELRGKHIGFVFQSFNLIATLTALENVELPMMYQGIAHKDRLAKARNLLEQLGVGDRAEHLPTELSGGEQQRVAIARALVNDPNLLLADEPTGNLDSKTGKQIMELLAKLNKEQRMTVVLVTHDPFIARYAQRTIHIFDGKVGQAADWEEE